MNNLTVITFFPGGWTIGYNKKRKADWSDVF